LRGRRDGYHGPTGLSSLGGLSALEELGFLGGESLSQADLAALASLRRLKVLSIMNSHLTDQGLTSICKLERLEQLRLDGTRVSRNGLNQLSGLKSLRDLDVQMWAEVQPTNVTEELTLDLSHLQGLKRLRLSGLALQEADMAFLPNLRHLEDVILGGNSLPGTSLRYLKGLPELVHLSADGLSRLTGEDLAPLAGLAKLETLRLAGDIADAAVASVDGLPRLRGLDVVTAAPIRQQTIADLEQRLPTIQYVHILEPPPQPTVAPQRPR
jgi:Leucine-rich repeat (LRR) protein